MKTTVCVTLFLLAGALAAQDSTPLAGWSPTGALTDARANGCAVRLPGNRVLVAGGTGIAGDLASAEIYSSDGTFAPAAAMNVARSHQTCTALADGRVLAAGGSADGSAEVYDPSADAWQTVSNVGEARSGQAAVLLADGRVLLAGGISGGSPSATIEIYDPQTNALTRNAGGLLDARQELAAALLPDGTVLVIGGRDPSGPVNTVELFDPSTGSLTLSATLSTARVGHAAVVLDDGRVLVAGGSDGGQELDSAEIYDGANGVWILQTARLSVPRRDPLALLIPGNGGVLIAGGQSGGNEVGATDIFLPTEGSFVALGSLTMARTGLTGAAFDDGAVLAAGGSNAGVPQTVCGKLSVPSLQFSAATVHPQETPTVTGNGFTTGTTVNLSLDLQGAIAGSIIASAQSRLLTTSVSIPQPTKLVLPAGFGPVPVFNAQVADAGQTFRLTAKSTNNLTATITVPVRVKVTMIATQLNPQFEGTNATFTVQLLRSSNPGPMGGTVTANLGSDVRTTAVNLTDNGVILSFAKTGVSVGTIAVSYTYSGDAQHEAASASATFTAISRTPVVSTLVSTITPAADGSVRAISGLAVVGSAMQITAQVRIAGTLPNPPSPLGTVTFLDHAAVLGTGVLSPVAGQPGLSAASMSFTPLTTTPISLSVSYGGTSPYVAGSSAVTAIPVQQAAATLQAIAPATFACGTAANVIAQLTFPPLLGLINRTVNLVASGTVNSLSLNSTIGQGTLAPALVAGKAAATISVILPKFTTSLSLQFSGDSQIGPATSAPVPIAVQPVPVVVAIASTPLGGGVTLTATVTPSASCGAPAPTGTVSFAEGGNTFAALVLPLIPPNPNVTDGTSNTILVAIPNSVSVTLALHGTHTFVAQYAGDAFHQAGVSAPVTVVFP